jgi:hypothetical protein
MANVKAIRVALATRLSTTGLNVHAIAPGQVIPPCAVIIPNRPAVNYGITMDGETQVNLLAVVLVSAANDASGQDVIDDYVSTSGTKSINAAVQADPTLGGAVEFTVVLQVMTYGLTEYAGQQYMGCSFLIQVGAHL